ncbi:MAG: class I SAM-dependent methyltransferase [Candidatus Sungbacteria bacterium]|nr:class I SAM-dependent methyltransferase [Candidatus Sungbacteria bacterium]
MNPYSSKEYNHRPRWVSYYYQYQSIFNLNAQSVLEVGIGNGLATKVLRDNNVKVITLDNNPETNPDVVGDVLHLPFEDDAFDVVAGFEILEHLPFSSFAAALGEMKRVAKKNVFISVPDHAKSLLRVTFKIPWMKEKGIQIRIPAVNNKKYWTPCGHFWEMGNIDFPFRKVAKEIEKSGLKIASSFIPNESAWTRYFILEK